MLHYKNKHVKGKTNIFDNSSFFNIRREVSEYLQTTLFMKIMNVLKSAVSWVVWIITRLLEAIYIPYKTLFKRKFFVRTLLWLVFSICFSLIGTIINIIKFAVFDIPKTSFIDKSFLEKVEVAIYIDSQSGTFYTFSIVLVASILYPLFECFIKHEWHYTHLRVITIIIGIMLVAFGGVFYSFSTIGKNPIDMQNISVGNYVWQKAFFFSSILLAAYSYGLGLLKEDDNHPQLDDYSDKENKSIENLEKKTIKIDSEQKDKEEVAL